MFAIPITEDTLELVTGLNEGVRPLVSVPHDYYVYTDHDTPATILSHDDFAVISMSIVNPPKLIEFWTI